jgi:hypothetical protein
VPIGIRGGQPGANFVLEAFSQPWSPKATDGERLLLQNDQRAYLAMPHEQRRWSSIKYHKLQLLGKTLHWTLDLSQVGCGCNAALYLVAMHAPDQMGSGYCDIQFNDPERCLEIDLFEGNIKAASATLHTEGGFGADGSCNQWGCAVNWGPADDNCKFGTGSRNIDSSRPFDMAADFDLDGHMSINMGQDGKWHRMWDVHTAGNGQPQVPEQASSQVKEALEEGMVLVASLWGADGDGMAWMDGGCTDAYPHCTLSEATAVFSQFRIDAVSLHQPEQASVSLHAPTPPTSMKADSPPSSPLALLHPPSPPTRLPPPVGMPLPAEVEPSRRGEDAVRPNAIVTSNAQEFLLGKSHPSPSPYDTKPTATHLLFAVALDVLMVAMCSLLILASVMARPHFGRLSGLFRSRWP